MVCCGNNSAVVDTSKPPAPSPAPKPQVKPVETAKPKEPAQQVKETPIQPKKAASKPAETPAPVSEPVPEPKGQSVPPPQTQQSAPVPDKTTPPEPKPAPAVVSPPAVTAPVTKSEPYLTSIVGPQLLQNGKVFPTEATLKRTAAVAIYYASANQDPDTTKKLEVFCAGYEARTLDVIYCPDSDEDVTVVPSSWYELPNDESGAIRSNLVNKLSLTSAPTLVILNPGVEKILDKSSFEKIISLDPLSSSYDTKACDIFDSWIKGLPMEQDVIREVQIILVE